MNYPGGKNGGGAYQNIINLIPPHEVYIEPFLGSGAVWRHKKPARRSVVVEKDCAVLESARAADVAGTDYLIYDGIEFLENLAPADREDVFVYADPPYLPETRSRLNLYRHEMTYEDHARLLDAICRLSCSVAISGYMSCLYAERLAGWRTFEYEAMTRGGTMRTETVWMNYPEPTALHEYTYLGTDRTDRQRVRRKIDRWRSKLAGLPRYEQRAIFESLQIK